MAFPCAVGSDDAPLNSILGDVVSGEVAAESFAEFVVEEAPRCAYAAVMAPSRRPRGHPMPMQEKPRWADLSDEDVVDGTAAPSQEPSRRRCTIDAGEGVGAVSSDGEGQASTRASSADDGDEVRTRSLGAAETVSGAGAATQTVPKRAKEGRRPLGGRWDISNDEAAAPELPPTSSDHSGAGRWAWDDGAWRWSWVPAGAAAGRVRGQRGSAQKPSSRPREKARAVEISQCWRRGGDDAGWDEGGRRNSRQRGALKKKTQGQIIIGIEEEPEFRVVRKILGTAGAHMKRIATSSGAKLRLRGRGSKFLEGLDQVESEDPLMLCLSAQTTDSYSEAVRLTTRHLEDVYKEYRAFCLRTGRLSPDLYAEVHEGPRDGAF